MKYCQGPKCHEYKTKDRIRGHKGDKHYETRKRVYYHDEFCDQRCMYDWMRMYGTRAVDHFGRIHEPKRTGCDSAWYKHCLLYTSPSPRDRTRSRMPSSA